MLREPFDFHVMAPTKYPVSVRACIRMHASMRSRCTHQNNAQNREGAHEAPDHGACCDARVRSWYRPEIRAAEATGSGIAGEPDARGATDQGSANRHLSARVAHRIPCEI